MSEASLLATVRNAVAPGYAELTMAGLREYRPDLVSAIEGAIDFKPKLDAARSEGRTEGAAAERERLNAIDGMMPPGMEKLRDEMKADGGVTADMAARRFLEAGNAARGAKLQGLKDADKTAAVAATVLSTATAAPGEQQPVLTGEAAWKAEFAKGETGFLSEADYIAFKKAEGRGGVKILQGRAGK